jgi:hypothetical protein
VVNSTQSPKSDFSRLRVKSIKLTNPKNAVKRLVISDKMFFSRIILDIEPIMKILD